jgi:hypothetical protein
VSGLVSVVFAFNMALNMASLLSNCAVEDQPAVIHFLWSTEIKISEMYRREHSQYGEQRGTGVVLLHDNARLHS